MGAQSCTSSTEQGNNHIANKRNAAWLKIPRALVAPFPSLPNVFIRSHLALSPVFLRSSLSLLAHTPLPSLRVPLTPRPISFLGEKLSQAILISSAVKSVVALAAVMEFFSCSSDTSASAVSALKHTKRNGFNRTLIFFLSPPWTYCC